MRSQSPQARLKNRTCGQPLSRAWLTWATALILAGVPQAASADDFGALVGPVPRNLAEVALAENQPAAEETGDEQSVAQRRVFGHLLYRNRRQQVLLSRAVRELSDGKTSEGLTYLQTLFDAPQDGFAWQGTESRLVSVRAEATRILAAQPPDVLQAYERLHRAEAEQMLADARRSGDAEQLRELGRRYYFTAAGFEALDWQAGRWFDQGRMGQAARIWRRLTSEPAHRHRVGRPLLVKTAVALHLAGHAEDARHIMQQLDSHAKLGDGSIADAGWLARQFPPDSPLAQSSRRGVSPGEQAGTGRRATTPFLAPVWSQNYTSGPDELLNSLVGDWKKHQQENLQPVAVANSAVVADGTIVLRDFGRIRAFDAASGRPRWSYRCATSLATLSRQSRSRVVGRAGTNRSNTVDVMSAYAGNGTLGMLSTDGQRVYAVDYVDLTRQPPSRGRFARNRPRATEEDPQLVSREANRLIALAVNPAADGNAVDQRPVWSIGGAVGTPEWFVRMDRDANGSISKAEFTGPAEQFRKIDTNEDGAIGLREAAAADGFSDGGNPLWGHFFLGAPLAVDGCLYAVTEADRQLNLVALKPETGELLWTQAIGFVEVPIEMDTNRYPLPCTPSFADGILVCPTQLGLLVGIDSSTGSLLWAYYYGDDQSLERLGRWPHRPQRSFAHTGFPAAAHVAGNRVVVLPRQSDSIHCLDVQTGNLLWTAPRQDAEYVGTIAGGRALIVGSRFCRGLSLETGEEQWTTRLGMPSGRGLPSGGSYLVPLEEGRIATLDLSTGREIGFTLPRGDQQNETAQGKTAQSKIEPDSASPGSSSSVIPGNLIAAGDLVLSAGARQLVAFPQAAPLLASIEDDFQNQPMPPQATVRAAELNLALGDIDQARRQLTDVLAQTMPPGDTQRAEELLRELLYLQLGKHPADNGRLFSQLERLSTTPLLRGRFLMQRAEAQLQQGDFAGVLQSTREFSEMNLSQPLPTVGDSSLHVTAGSWVRSIVGRMQKEFGDARFADVLARIDDEQQESLASDGTLRLERFLNVYSQWPQAEAPRSELARRYVAAGRFQEAELLLLTNRDSENREHAAEATALLAGLWDRLGLWHEAAGQLKRLDERFADLRTGEGRSTRELSPALSPSSLTTYALRQLERPDWDIARVDILERPWIETDPQLAEAYGRYRRRFPTSGDSSYQLLVKGSSGDEELAVIDRQTGLVVSTVSIPARVSYPTSQRMSNVGHFVPLGGPAAMNGISLLARPHFIYERGGRPLWTTQPTALPSQQEVLRVGPAGPSFCSFQARRHLVVAEPAGGRILWQRTDLDPNGGLLNDPYAGLFGDDEVLVLFAADRSSYIVYETATGEILRTGQLEIEVNQQRRVFGRKLCYVARLESGLRLRIWDPLEDRIEFDEAFDGRLFSAVTPDEDQLAVILPPGRLVVVDVAASRRLLDCRLEPADLANLNYLRIFGGGERYFVNFQRAARVPPSRTYSYYASDTFLDAVHVQGDLLAVHRQTGRVEWRRTLPQRSFIRTPHFDLPFLITLSGVRDRWNGNRQSLLIEVIDAATGETIGLKDDLPPDRIVQCTYQPERGSIRLHGLKTLVELRFDRGRQRLGMEDLPL